MERQYLNLNINVKPIEVFVDDMGDGFLRLSIGYIGCSKKVNYLSIKDFVNRLTQNSLVSED